MGIRKEKQTMNSRFTIALVAAATVQSGEAIKIEQYGQSEHYDLATKMADAVIQTAQDDPNFVDDTYVDGAVSGHILQFMDTLTGDDRDQL